MISHYAGMLRESKCHVNTSKPVTTIVWLLTSVHRFCIIFSIKVTWVYQYQCVDYNHPSCLMYFCRCYILMASQQCYRWFCIYEIYQYQCVGLQSRTMFKLISQILHVCGFSPVRRDLASIMPLTRLYQYNCVLLTITPIMFKCIFTDVARVRLITSVQTYYIYEAASECINISV